MSDLMAFTAPEAQAPTIDVPAGYDGDENALLASLLGKFTEAEDASHETRHNAERARAFRDGDHWSAEELAVLKQRRQPPVYNNVIGRKIDLLRGLERRGRSDPKAFPRTPNEENRADVATQILRYIADDSRFDVIRSAVYDNMLVEGVGGCEVIVEPEDDDYRVVINQIPYERLFWDPHSQHPGFTDSSYIGLVIWMDREEALDRYPGCDDILSDTFESSSSDMFDDKPRMIWCDTKRKRVRVVQIWWKRRADWWCATVTKGGFLEPAMKSPYIDRRGVACCPIILRSARVGRDNERFGVVKDMIPLQEEINKRRSKLLHSLSVNQIIMTEGAVQDVDRARREVAKPDGVVVYNPNAEFRIQKDQAEIAGQFQLLQDAVHQLDLNGPNAAMSGKDPREQSGRAILAQQAGGQVEAEPLADELRQWTHKVWEAAWMRARQFWTEQKTIRVTDEEKDVQFVTLNRKVTLDEELMKMPPDRAQQIAQQMGLMPGDPRLQQVVRIDHDMDDLDVDVTLEEGPDNPTMAAEQFQQIMQLPPMVLQNFPPAFFVKASSLRNKDALLAMLEEHQQQQAEAQAGQKEAAEAMQQAQVSKVAADAADKKAGAMVKLHGIAADHATLMQPAVVQAPPEPTAPY